MRELVKSFEGEKVRVIIEKGEPLFCLVDVCAALNLDRKSRLITEGLDYKGVVNRTVKTRGGEQLLNYINEANLYRVVFRSKKEEAKRFQDWVFEEVLPAVRKTGKYEIPADAKKKAALVRNTFTEVLQGFGVSKALEYVKITATMKKNIGIPGNKPKDQLALIELKQIQAAELLAEINMLQQEPEGYEEVKPICQEAARSISSAIERKSVS